MSQFARRPKIMPLRGGVAVVTGAASGIGAALAANLAARGCNLALADLNVSGLREVASAARASGVTVSEHTLDVADESAVAALPDAVLAEHRRVTVLVNNAGVAVGGTFLQTPAGDFEWLMNINFWGVVRMSRAFLPVLQREPVAQLVNVSSISGIVAPPGQTAYAASKFAVRGFSESLRHELEDAGSSVGVTIVLPGGVRTAIASSARSTGLSNAETDAQGKMWERLLRLSPAVAAETIVRGIERREARVLIGSDAKQAAILQRLMPRGYWRLMKRAMERGLSKTASRA